MNDYKKIRPVHPLYPAVIFIVLCLATLGLFIFIIPTFAEILSDISEGQASLPASTQLVFDLAHYLWHPMNFIILALLLLLCIIIAFYANFIHRRNTFNRYITAFSDYIRWHLPIIHAFEKNNALLQFVEVLRMGIRASKPMDEILQNSLNLDINWCFRIRLTRWHKAIQQGENNSESARRNRIGASIAWALDSDLNAGNTQDILTTLEDVYRSRYNYWLNLGSSIICPVAILCMALMVGFIMYAIMNPMIKMLYVLM